MQDPRARRDGINEYGDLPFPSYATAFDQLFNLRFPNDLGVRRWTSEVKYRQCGMRRKLCDILERLGNGTIRCRR